MRVRMFTGSRKLVTALAALVMTILLAMPVSAAPLSYDIDYQFDYFDTVYYNNAYSGYTVALQRFLQCYSQYYANILKNAEVNGNGGVDGRFGQYTYSALTDFQGNHYLDPDGWAGPNTWGVIATCLREDPYGDYKILSVNGLSVIGAFLNSGIPDYFIYYNGYGNGGSKFHDCVIELR